MSEGVPTSPRRVPACSWGVQTATPLASTAGTGTGCVNKPLLLSFENPDPIDQILTSHRAREVVCVCEDPCEITLNIT